MAYVAGLRDMALKEFSFQPQIPGSLTLKKAAESKTYCDELTGTIESHGLEITELSTHLQGQLIAVHPAYDLLFHNR